MSLRVLGIIPARGGSKGIPGKNIRSLAGRPMISYTIDAARQSRCLARCVVSTDSEEIRRVSMACGADVPFLRPAELAQDDTPTLPVILHALSMLGQAFDAVMVLQPTSPFREAHDIDSAVQCLAATPDCESVISVVAVGDHHPARMKMIRDGLLVDPPFAEAAECQRRQDLPAYYLRNGAIYLTRTHVLQEQQSFKGRRCVPYIMPEERSVNVDSPFDLLLAEALLRKDIQV